MLLYVDYVVGLGDGMYLSLVGYVENFQKSWLVIYILEYPRFFCFGASYIFS